MKNLIEKPDVMDYVEVINGSPRPNLDMYGYDVCAWKLSRGDSLSVDDKTFMKLYEQKLRNKGQTDIEVEINDNRQNSITEKEIEKKKIDLLCDVLVFLTPFLTFGIVKTTFNAVRKINR
jgi:hypothetical protein